MMAKISDVSDDNGDNGDVDEVLSLKQDEDEVNKTKMK